MFADLQQAWVYVIYDGVMWLLALAVFIGLLVSIVEIALAVIRRS